jgi:hypothetical protein
VTDQPFYAPNHSQQSPESRSLARCYSNSSANRITSTFGANFERTKGGALKPQFWMNGELLIGRRFDTRALAVQWAMVEREHLAKGHD